MSPGSALVKTTILVLMLIANFLQVDTSTGESQQISMGNSFNEAWSPDGQFIAFGSDRAGELDIWLMEPDGSNPINLTANLSGDSGNVSWSPDGKQIAFSSNHAGNDDIWVIELNGANPVNLTSDMASDEGDPMWSPDGRFIAFVSTQNDAYGIWVVNAENSLDKQRISPPDEKTYLVPNWLSDNQTIIFEGGTSASFQIWKATIDGEMAMPLIAQGPDHVAHVHVCTTNDRIVFTNLAENLLGEIWVMHSDGSELTNLTPDKQGASPECSPDGRFIAFRSLRGTKADIWVMESDGSNEINLTKDIDGVFSPKWSPDNTQITFSAVVDGNSDVWIVNVDGSNLQNLTGDRK